jgi:hypothetical protein
MKDADAVEIEVQRLLGALSYQDLHRVLGNLLWDVFGDVDEEGKEVLLPGRSPDKVDVLSLVTSLRQEFWPKQFPDGSSAEDGEEEEGEEDDEEDDEDERHQPDCYYGDATCKGPLWTCQTCKEEFCGFHWHETDRGRNVECVACEQNRKDRHEE